MCVNNNKRCLSEDLYPDPGVSTLFKVKSWQKIQLPVQSKDMISKSVWSRLQNVSKKSRVSDQAQSESDLRASSDLRELNILYLNEFPNLTLATKLAQLTSSDLQ